MKEMQTLMDYYLANAKILKGAVTELGLKVGMVYPHTRAPALRSSSTGVFLFRIGQIGSYSYTHDVLVLVLVFVVSVVRRRQQPSLVLLSEPLHLGDVLVFVVFVSNSRTAATTARTCSWTCRAASRGTSSQVRPPKTPREIDDRSQAI
jgi:hypothetical protein